MCSIVSLVSFKSTERVGIKVFFYIWAVVLPIWPKNMLQTFFQQFFLQYKALFQYVSVM